MIFDAPEPDPRAFVREYRENYVNLYELWTAIAAPPDHVELTTPYQTPITEKDLPPELLRLVREYRREHRDPILSFIKHIRIEDGRPVRVVEDQQGLPGEDEFMSVSRTYTLNTSDVSRVVTEIYVARIKRARSDSGG